MAQHDLCGENNGNPNLGILKLKPIIHVFMQTRIFQFFSCSFYANILQKGKEPKAHFYSSEVNVGFRVRVSIITPA